MKRHVALIVETSSIYGRDLLSGIVRYMRLNPGWSVYLEQRDLWKQPPAWLHQWRGDGIITRATPGRLLDAVARTGVPTVNVGDRGPETPLPGVRSDDAAIGRTAAGHLLERGFERFGYCGYKGDAWSKRREDAFAEAVEARTLTPCSRFNTTWHGPAAQSWEAEQDAIADWLKTFEPPFAVMAGNDLRGHHVIDACAKLGLAVPEQAAVIGVDNDELICHACSPPLSSVIPNAGAVGFRAAELLTRLMDGRADGQAVDEPAQAIPPIGVVTRQSTDVVAIEDRAIAAALHYIRQHACRGLSVDEVVQNNPISRSTLERQIRKYLGRTPQEEIRHVQIMRAREFLRATDLAAERIASLCGFDHPEYLHVVFKRITGMTMSEFRKQAKP